MSAEQGYLGTNLTVWGVATGAGVTIWAAKQAPMLLLLSLGILSVLWLIATLSLVLHANRTWLAGTLRKGNFTQIYTSLTKKTVDWLWGRFCDPAEKGGSVFTLFRAALTWRLYDAALLIAVAYPIVLATLQWIALGQETRLGSFLLYPEVAFWPARAAVLGAFVILICGFVGRKLAAASQQRFAKSVADWLPIIALAAAAVAAGAVLFALALAGAVVLAGAVAFAVLVAGPGALAVAFAVLVAFQFAVAFAGAVVLAGAVTLAGIATIHFDRRGRQVAVRWVVTVGVVGAAITLAIFADWDSVAEDERSVFLFLAVFPLINALFDTVSYAATLTLIRRGLRAKLPILWGFFDLLIACGLFLGLGAVLVFVLHSLNLLANAPLIDLEGLFLGVWIAPGDYIWLYLMLFSTILPTALHFLVSLIGLQGIWLEPTRRRVADWVKGAGAGPGAAVRAAAALTVIWAVPVYALATCIWLLWHFAGRVVIWFLDWYFHWLLWIADVPVGAF